MSPIANSSRVFEASEEVPALQVTIWLLVLGISSYILFDPIPYWYSIAEALPGVRVSLLYCEIVKKKNDVDDLVDIPFDDEAWAEATCFTKNE
ncbi:hypothetical protein Tco_1560770 [Tanacetum coccineum]